MSTTFNINWSHQWVDTQEKLSSLCDFLSTQELISVDTETVGWQSGNEKLCLIQLGIPTREDVAIVDPLSLSNLDALASILSAETPRLVAHNASFEQRQFGRHGIKLHGLIDTLTLVRNLRPDLPNHTLQTCCKLLLNLEISKEEQTSDWSNRPLSQEQLRYACLDAIVTIHLYQVLMDMQAKLDIDAALEVPELMESLWQTVRQRIDLTSSIAWELAITNAKEVLLRERIKHRLLGGDSPYKGRYGECNINKVKTTEISPVRVREMFPQIADLVIAQYVEKKRLLAIMEEQGIDKKKVDEVTDITGYIDRLHIALKDI